MADVQALIPVIDWLLLLAFKNSLDVASAVKNANYVYAIFQRQVEHDVLADDKASQIGIKFKSSASNSRPPSQKPESFVYTQRECVGISHAVFGYVRPDLGEIKQGAWTF
jgi:hypothetical protein